MKAKSRLLSGSAVSLFASLPPVVKPVPKGMVTTAAPRKEDEK